MIRKASAAKWLLLLLPTLLIPAYAIYEDQAGTFDWYKQYVGRPTSVAFAPGKERIYLTTNQNLLASLQTKAGQVAWRRKYTDQDTLEKTVVVQKPGLIVAASQGGKYLRAWDALEGAFKWEALVFDGPVSAAAGSACDITALESGSKGAAVAVAAADKLKLIGAQKGDTLWSADLEQASQGSHKLLLPSNDVITVLSYTPGSADVYLVSVDSADGSHRDTDRFTAAAPLGPLAAAAGRAAAFISSRADQVCMMAVADGASASGVSCLPVQDVLPSHVSSSSQLQLAAVGPGSFSLSVQGQPGVAILSVDGQSKWYADAVAAVPATATSPAAAAGSAASPLALILSAADGSSIAVQLLAAATGEDIAEKAVVAVPAAAYPVSGPPPRVVAAWVDAHKYAAGTTGSSSSKKALKGARIVLLWSDDQLSLISDGEIAWTREEALASSTSNLMIDPPAARQAAAAAGTQQQQQQGGAAGLLGLLQDQSMLKRWVRLQVLSVLVQFKLASQQEHEEFLQLRQALSDNNLPFRDTNGFRKFVVLLTAPGKVFALHSGDGRIMWASNGPTAFSSGDSSSSTQYLRVWKRYHDLQHAPELVVITAGDKSSAVQVLNSHTGALLREETLEHGIEKVIPQHQPVHDGAADQFTFLLVEPLPHTTNPDTPPLPKVHLLPNSAIAQQQLAKRSSSLFFWLLQQNYNGSENGSGSAADEAAGGTGELQQQQTVLRGYGFEAGGQGAAAAESLGLLTVVPAWQVVLPGQLLGLAAKDPAEPVHSYVKILGDRSLKYRYLNPNLLFVATGSTGAVSPEDQTVSVTLLNTVTGGVVHQQVHHGCAGPVHAVLSEHWVVYTMRDVTSLRQQVTVIELYDASPHDLSIGSVILGRTKHSAALSSYAAPPLEVLSQSFYLQHAVKGLGVTQTKQGITTKQLLVRTISDQVYALDKRFLDPRRPLRAKVTAEEAEERLLPYNEFLVFSTLQYPTLDKQVLNLRGVTVAPAVLESTTLVFCYGSDLFFTRITPAQHFDSLQSDFSYGLLVVALLVLIIGSVFARYSSEQTMLKAKWQ